MNKNGSNNTLTVREAALRLGIDLNYAYTLLWSGKLKGEKSGGRWVIAEASVADRERQRKDNDNGWQKRKAQRGTNDRRHARTVAMSALNAKRRA